MTNRNFTTFSILIGTVLLSISCKKLVAPAPEADSVMDAPLEGLTPGQYKLFNEGAEEFDEAYTAATGLGPIYVASSCASCHGGDGRGNMFTALTRFGQDDTSGNKFLQFGAPQIQNHSILGYTPEQLPSGATSSKFLAPIAAGVGFLELVSDADIVSISDPMDADGDGISGVPNWNSIPAWVTPNSNAIMQNGKYICRFGRKGSTYNLHQQTTQAFNQDMGITTSFMPVNPVNYQDGANPVAEGDPEVSNNSLNALVFYLQVLQTPFQRNSDDAQVVSGKNIFVQVGCEKCHRQTLKTGYSPVSALSYKEFHPYTDLLLHDMGPGLDDHYTEGSAQTYEWRTTPLWGLGLTTSQQGGQYYLLHDGRAHSIEEAILMHGGEASASVSDYKELSSSEKESLLAFLKSL